MPDEGTHEKKRDRTRLKLIDAALTLFERQGYEGTTVEQIAEAAEVTSRTFFRYFTNKEDVLMLGQADENRQLAELVKARPSHQKPLDFMLEATQVVLNRSPELVERARRGLKVLSATPSLRHRDTGTLAEIQTLFVKALTPPRASKAEALRMRVLIAAYLAVANTVMNAHLAGELKGDPFEHLAEAVESLRHGFDD